MARSKPKTSYYLKYGAAVTSNDTAALSPVFIGPHYAVHKAAYDNSVASGATIVSGGAVASVAWPSHVSGGVVDQNSIEVYVNNPVVQLGKSAGGAIGKTVGVSGSVITFDGAVTGAEQTVFQNNYQLQKGDLLIMSTGAPATVVGFGQSTNGATGQLLDNTATVTNAWTVTNPNGANAVYYLSATSGGTLNGVKMGIKALSGDTSFADSEMIISGGKINTIGNLGVTLSATSTTVSGVTSGAVFYLQAANNGGVGVYDKVYVDRDLTSSNKVQYIATSNFVLTGSAKLSNSYWSQLENGSGVSIEADAKCEYEGGQYDVFSGGISVEYRELIPDLANQLIAASDTGAAEWVGQLDPDNPIGEAYKAAIQTGDVGFFLMATEDDSLEAFQKAVTLAGKTEDAYSIIPIEQNAANIAAARAIEAYYSQPEIAQMKRVWVYSQVKQNQQLLPSKNYPVTVATVAAGDGDSVVTLPTGQLAAAGVGIGDILTLKNVTIDGAAQDVSARITQLDGNTVHIAATDITAGSYLAEVTRKLSSTELAKAVAAEARTYNDPRVNYVYAEPNYVADDYFEDAQYIVPVLATLRHQLAPHAPLTDVTIPGVSISDGIGFSESDLNIMNDAGVWVCYRDGRGEMVTRHAVTTGGDGTIAEEDSAVSNGDNILRTIRNNISFLRGNCNVTTALINQIYVNVMHALDAIQARSYDALVGPQILEVRSVKVEQDPNNTAGVIGQFDLDLPDVYLEGNFTVNLF